MLSKLQLSVVAAATSSLIGLTYFGTSIAQDESTEKDYSYAVGTKIGAQMKQQFSNPQSGIDLEAMLSGLNDTVLEGDVKMTAEEADAAIAAWQQAQTANAAVQAEAAVQKGIDFRAENKTKPGVVETESGLQYTVITSGDVAGVMPSATDTVVVHYSGTLIDGTEFDSSYARGEPATFSLTGIIPGWTEILQLMRPGDKWSVVIPPELAYGERGAGAQIGANETLVFEIELIEVKEG